MRICLKTSMGAVLFALAFGVHTLAAQTPAQGTSPNSTSKTRHNRKSANSTSAEAATPAAPANASAASPAPAGKSTTAGKARSEPVNNASDAEISSAKTSGKVWVNTSSGTYHKAGRYYGKTKQGKFMTENDAKKAGYHEAKGEIGTKKG